MKITLEVDFEKEADLKELIKLAVLAKNKLNELKVTDIDADIFDLSLSTRAYKGLKNHGINKISELCLLADTDILKICDINKKTLTEIKDNLRAHNLELKEHSFIR